VPFGVVLTLPATGSEMNSGAVIRSAASQEKLVFSSPLVFPKFAILDPETTYSLPPRQIANGVVDAFAHVMEQYCTYPVHAPLQDRFAEGILESLLNELRGQFALHGLSIIGFDDVSGHLARSESLNANAFCQSPIFLVEFLLNFQCGDLHLEFLLICTQINNGNVHLHVHKPFC